MSKEIQAKNKHQEAATPQCSDNHAEDDDELKSTESAAETVPVSAKKSDPVHRITKIILIIALLLFVWYIVADRFAPWTDQARIQAYIVPIVPQVAGNIAEINVTNNQQVKAGQVLFKIDPTDYQLALESAQSAVELAGQDIGASSAAVSTAQAKLVEAKTTLDYVIKQSKRVFELEKQKVLSLAEGDKARAAIEQAKTGVESAKAELEKSRQELGSTGEDNPRLRSALADLKQAQTNLARTVVYAPSLGGITNLLIDEGHYAKVGTPLMTFVDFQNIWIRADLRENSIANIKQGDAVDIALDIAPGKVFQGKVSSVGFAVENETSGRAGSLVDIKGKSGWLRDSQRFPVFITFTGDSAQGLRRVGGQADVQLYTTNNFIINSIGWIWIRVLSWLSYVY